VTHIDLQILLGGTGEPADLVDERDASRERTGPEMGRDQVIQDAPVLDTVRRMELLSRDSLSHAAEANTRPPGISCTSTPLWVARSQHSPQTPN
jgi:hypothetical protein